MPSTDDPSKQALNLGELLSWLREENVQNLERLFTAADRVRHEHVGDAVQLRGLIEISNVCARSCGYCGLRAPLKIPRYRLTETEILDRAHEAERLGFGTVVLQAGEDPTLDRAFIARLVRRLREETPLAITLSLGERSRASFEAWREAGADRYLLRFETSNPALFEAIHPPLRPNGASRFEMLGWLRELDYEVGSGVMIGIPGQTYPDLAQDIAVFRELGLDMIGVGPFIAHPDTPLGKAPRDLPDQVPNTEAMTYKVLALTRLVRPDANIPSTTALATVNAQDGRELGLRRGANVVMPNLTPAKYRSLYSIYPEKACPGETAEEVDRLFRKTLERLGRHAGDGRGDSASWQRRERDPITSPKR